MDGGTPPVRVTGHDRQVADTVARSREAAAKLELVAALAMALPARDPGPLTYPTWASLRT
jgi:hypothetical protein